MIFQALCGFVEVLEMIYCIPLSFSRTSIRSSKEALILNVSSKEDDRGLESCYHQSSVF